MCSSDIFGDFSRQRARLSRRGHPFPELQELELSRTRRGIKSMKIGTTVQSLRLVFISAVMITAAGCAEVQSTISPAWTPTQTAGTASAPRVEDCAIVGISSPSKFACGGKVYTSFQLAKLRMAEEKKYAAGK
jgi:hypothetical protein